MLGHQYITSVKKRKCKKLWEGKERERKNRKYGVEKKRNAIGSKVLLLLRPV